MTKASKASKKSKADSVQEKAATEKKKSTKSTTGKASKAKASPKSKAKAAAKPKASPASKAKAPSKAKSAAAKKTPAKKTAPKKAAPKKAAPKNAAAKDSAKKASSKSPKAKSASTRSKKAITKDTKVQLTSGPAASQEVEPKALKTPIGGFEKRRTPNKRLETRKKREDRQETLSEVPLEDRIKVLKEMSQEPKAKPAAKKKTTRAKAKRPRKARSTSTETGDMDSNLINSYLKEVSRHSLLNQQEEKDLARAIHRDDDNARRRLIQSNLRLVVKMAKKYVKKGVSLLDLIQEGNRGLMMAVEKYDPEKGFRFTTYASWWIKQALIRTIANQSRVIRLPVHMNETIARIKKTSRILALQLGRKPLTSEIANYIQMPEEKVEYALQANKDTISMDYARNSTEEAGTLNYFLENKNVPRPEEIIKNKLLKEQLEHVLKTLSFKERMVIQYRFGLINGKVKTLEEIGSEFGVTRERIRQIEAKALRQLRHPSRSQKLEDFY